MVDARRLTRVRLAGDVLSVQPEAECGCRRSLQRSHPRRPCRGELAPIAEHGPVELAGPDEGRVLQWVAPAPARWQRSLSSIRPVVQASDATSVKAGPASGCEGAPGSCRTRRAQSGSSMRHSRSRGSNRLTRRTPRSVSPCSTARATAARRLSNSATPHASHCVSSHVSTPLKPSAISVYHSPWRRPMVSVSPASARRSRA